MEDFQEKGLYRSEYEHDACGVGMVANLSGEASRAIVEGALGVLKRLTHRGATGNDPGTGDGAGILLKLPDGFFRTCLKDLPPKGEYAVAMVFGAEGEEALFEGVSRENGCEAIAWRDVPVDPGAVGPVAREAMPKIRQFFVTCPSEIKLYAARREIEKRLKNGYICSFSSKTVVYKGLLLATQMEKFYLDLGEKTFASPFAIVHQRYSTNTFPSWELAHPFRAIAHNGEINAIKGNLNSLSAHEKSLASQTLGDDLKKILPLVGKGQSDSASLDNIFELLVAAGRDAPHAMMMLLPQAWGRKYHMGHDIRAFYEYHSALMEPWDGPAAVAFTDGTSLGAALDRNGLRPARWTLSKDGLFVLASETGVLDMPAAEVERHGRLKPGSLLWLDLESHRLMEDRELKTFYARRMPYRRWVAENHIPVNGLFTEIVPSEAEDETALRRRRERFGWSLEDVELVVRPMAETGSEAVGAMGNDAALACLSGKRRSLFDFFHQLFAQVTNPPIDPIREELVMSIMTYIGNKGNFLAETEEHAKLVKMTRPVLTDDELARLKNIPEFPAKTLSLEAAGDLKDSLDALASASVEAVKEGAKILVLSDRSCEGRRVPSLLALAAVNKSLSGEGLRPSVGVVVESGEVFEVHHFAVLLGFGATAVNPYLAFATVSSIGSRDRVKAAANYVSAVCKGLMKVMSKMGISTLRSYRSAGIFEVVGLGPKLMAEYFPGVASPVGGLELEDLELTLLGQGCGAARGPVRSTAARGPVRSTASGGLYRYRKGGEEHLWSPERVVDFRESVRNGDYSRFRKYADSIDSSSSVTLRSRFSFKETEPVALEEVESAESMVKRFVGGAMSLGSLSPEAHETIAVALNSLGTMSNSGEGGENRERFGTDRASAIKQVASGRFGVTIEYLRSAKDIQIKLAQGAKPGEGGQLPAHKVDEFVGRLRHAKPGTTLISPPPHHDIYSIEDLAELIYDLKCANPSARVSVKLVSEAGVGTIAAGVAKAHADAIVISGFDGGTGAAPLTSMKHAGLPWETGLAEAHQTLVKNGLRSRVRLQVDGQLRTGRDIVTAAMLGADEFAFGTPMLVSLGCVQCRNCNLNSCPVGIATQKRELREKFSGKPEHLKNFFLFLAENVRERLASLGLRSLAEARGRSDLLRGGEGFAFADLFAVACDETPGREEDVLASNYDRRELVDAILPALPGKVRLSRKCMNVDRAVGTLLSGEIAGAGFKLEDETVSVDFEGVGGQSFGAFLAKGVTFNLRGEANDYLGKGLSGGIVTLAPPEDFPGEADRNAIAGNVIAYGATSGKIFINGLAGERFAVRNSGATLVVEGIGDHGCEYMTGGTVVVLGPVGVNFAAGMTGGVAYVCDEAGDLDLNSNLDSVDIFPVEEGSADESELLGLLREHVSRTGSPKASRILYEWREWRHLFAKVCGRVPCG
ncbi:MAG: glutamate synthase large subunit [Kiritimatiellae bacterium]|nr:glutamate synthase large subunit [Kiritimatiellia bacterium]